MDPALVLRFAIVLARTGMVVATAPVFGSAFAPTQVKIGLIVLLTATLMPVVPLQATALTTAGIAMVIAREAAIGMALSMSIRVLVGAAELAGYLSGFQLGFSYAATIDPQSGVRNNIIASLYGSLTLLAFLGIDGHHALIRALARSYQAVPPGLGEVGRSLPATAAQMLGLIFLFGAQLAAPVVIVLLVVELGLGLISRSAPQLNLMVIGFPVRLLVGLLALAATIQVVPAVMSGVVSQTFEAALRAVGAFR